jgi:chromosome segregation ATPase
VVRDVDWSTVMTGKRIKTPPWAVIFEDMRSQNRATIEAVESSRIVLEQRLDRLDAESRARDASLELAIRDLRVDVGNLKVDVVDLKSDVRGLKADVRGLKSDVNGLKTDVDGLKTDVRDLAGKVVALARLEDRVSALERRGA